MSLFFLVLLGGALAVAIIAWWLRRPGDDRSGEALGLGEGSNLSAENPSAPHAHSTEGAAARDSANEADEA